MLETSLKIKSSLLSWDFPQFQPLRQQFEDDMILEIYGRPWKTTSLYVLSANQLIVFYIEKLNVIFYCECVCAVFTCLSEACGFNTGHYGRTKKSQGITGSPAWEC